ncbi:hypothetical protein F7725_003586 [Dissostichus mawsoni]|uniref:Uncharacterized protein n=1 Tax=Dissostichus mawsoni TaxID=36200 RepID=A0A7J5YDZ4_DISMA|nr:hypothetical protein F7725_003586 [Dissostichus mawsoni]
MLKIHQRLSPHLLPALPLTLRIQGWSSTLNSRFTMPYFFRRDSSRCFLPNSLPAAPSTDSSSPYMRRALMSLSIRAWQRSDHSECMSDSCGPLAECTDTGGCVCVAGYEIPPGHLPTPDSYGCAESDECLRTSEMCGSYSNCTNTIGSYTCTCWVGYIATNRTSPPSGTNPCTDYDECCDEICGPGTCTNNVGSYACECHDGYKLVTEATPECQDIDECLNITICGPESICTNTPGAYTCKCRVGFAPTDPAAEPNMTNICIDVVECAKVPPICGPYSNCTNSIGSYFCDCFHGFRLNKLAVIASYNNPCTDIDECSENPGICGKDTVCTNVLGTFYCSCPDGLFPSTGIVWTVGFTYCQTIESVLEEIKPPEGQTKERAFLGNMDDQLKEHVGDFLPPAEVSGVGPRVKSSRLRRSSRVSSAGDGKTGSVILGISDRLVAAMVQPVVNQTKINVKTETVEQTEMYSDVMTAILTSINNTNLTEPVNFTIQHKKTAPENGLMTCVYWEEKTEETIGENTMSWSVEGCWIAYTNENYTVCSCSHLSTFALIMQIGELACTVMAGLLHFLIVAGFVWMLLEALQLHLLVRRLTKVQVIQRDGLPRPILFVIGYGVPFVIVGVSAVIYSDGYGATAAEVCWLSRTRNFYWALTGPVILILALNWILFLATLWSLRPTLVNMKSGVSQSKDTTLILFKIVAQFVILGCTWILGLYQSNLFFQVLFIILNSQQGTFLFVVHCLLNKEVRDEYIKWLTCSFNKKNKDLCIHWALPKNSFESACGGPLQMLIVFKIVAQFVILGCTWMLGLYQSNLCFRVLFVILNSQQGTFLFIVHCALNKEVVFSLIVLEFLKI